VFTIVTLTENALMPHDVQRVAHLHDPEPVRVHLVVPVDTERNRLVETFDNVALSVAHLGRPDRDADEPTAEAAEAAARSALDASIAALTEAGVETTGDLAPDDPVGRVAAVARGLDADEIIVVTDQHLLEESLHRDWASRLRDEAGRPVLHFVAGTDRVVS
jgi:hypothetical protein